MQLILKKEVQNLGEPGDLINAKDGYARNYLLPNGLAEVATAGALKKREQNIERIKAKAEKLHQDALQTAKKIEALENLQLQAKAGESGKLFGAVTTKKLSEELKEKLGFEIDRKVITLNSPINRVGEFVMTIKLTSKVKATLPVLINASEVIKEEIISEEETEKE